MNKKGGALQMIILIYIIIYSVAQGQKSTNADLSLEQGMKRALPYYNKDEFYDFTKYVLGPDAKLIKKNSEGSIDKKLIYVIVKALQNETVLHSFAFGVKKECQKTINNEAYSGVYLSYIKDSQYAPQYSSSLEKNETGEIIAKVYSTSIARSANNGINYYSYFFIGWTILTLAIMIFNFVSNLKLFSSYDEVQNYEEDKFLTSRNLESSDNLMPKHSQDGIWRQFVDGFNPIENIKALFKPSDSSHNELSFLDGLRVLAGLRIVYVHAKMFYNQKYATKFKPIEGNLNWMIIDYRPDRTFAVDVFFFLSAFLATISLIKVFSGEGLNIKILTKAILNRVLRLFFPTFALKMLELGFRQCIFYNLRWFDYFFTNQVEDHIWFFEVPLKLNIPFINYVFRFDYGFIINWYLFSDFDYFCILAIVIMAYIYRKAYGYLICIVIILCSISKNLLIYAHLYELNENSSEYFNGTLRAGPYFIGALFGFAYHEYLLERKSNQTITKNGHHHKGTDFILGHLILKLQTSVSRTKKLLEFATLITPLILWNLDFTNLIKNVMRNLYILALGLLCVHLITGRLKQINQILSHSIFAVGSRLAFTIYLFHIEYMPAFMNCYYKSSDPSYSFFFYLLVRKIIISIIVSILITFLFEIPYININSRLLFKRQRNRETKGNQIGEYQHMKSKKKI